MSRWFPLACLLTLLVSGCGNRATVEREIDDYDGSVRQSTSFSQESDLERAGRLVSERDYPGAVEIYRRLYRSSPDQAVRAESLLRWAQAEGNLLNPDRDLDQAIARLELMLGEFEDSPLRDEARRELERLRGLRDAEPGS